MAKRAETKNKKKTVKQPKVQAKGAKGRKARRDSKKTAKAESKGTVIFIGNPKQQQQKKGPTMVIGLNRPQSGPKKKKKLSGISAKQRMENEKRANIREAQRGKVGPKRNVIKTKSGILRDKSGKAVKRLSREEVLKRRKANK
jgi:hypothetical protein